MPFGLGQKKAEKPQEKPKSPPKPKKRALSAEVEFPKMLYKDEGNDRMVVSTWTVANVPELESALKDGWKERTR